MEIAAAPYFPEVCLVNAVLTWIILSPCKVGGGQSLEVASHLQLVRAAKLYNHNNMDKPPIEASRPPSQTFHSLYDRMTAYIVTANAASLVKDMKPRAKNNYVTLLGPVLLITPPKVKNINCSKLRLTKSCIPRQRSCETGRIY